MSFENKKVAIVCDWLVDFGGAEKVLEYFLEIFPHADIYTSVFFMRQHPLFEKYLTPPLSSDEKEKSEHPKIYTTFIQKIPLLNKRHKLCLTLRPLAFESLNLSEYDIVISSSTAESKGVITKPQTLHICYCHTPVRYFWSHYHEYLRMLEFGVLNPLARWLMPKVIHKLRKWDFVAAQRPDYFVANSENTKLRIEKYYNREAEVISPGISFEEFPLIEEKKDYYFYAGRCIPYKRFDMVVEAFNKNGKPLIIATNTENALYKKLKTKSKSNITWIVSPTQSELAKLYSEARAFLFPPEEDFGLSPIEAMATGTPVIAYKAGGAKETVQEGISGMFFDAQTSNALSKAIEEFETLQFHPQEIRKSVEKYRKELFLENFQDFISSKL